MTIAYMDREIESDATPHELLHRLWTKAVGTEHYVKAEWRRLEALVQSVDAPAAKAPELRDPKLHRREPDEIERILKSWQNRVLYDLHMSDGARAVLGACLKQIEAAYIGPDPAGELVDEPPAILPCRRCQECGYLTSLPFTYKIQEMCLDGGEHRFKDFPNGETAADLAHAEELVRRPRVKKCVDGRIEKLARAAACEIWAALDGDEIDSYLPLVDELIAGRRQWHNDNEWKIVLATYRIVRSFREE